MAFIAGEWGGGDYMKLKSEGLLEKHPVATS
jgi:hypothetical protein